MAREVGRWPAALQAFVHMASGQSPSVVGSDDLEFRVKGFWGWFRIWEASFGIQVYKQDLHVA